MGPAASVLSIDRIQRLKEALARFGNDGQTALALAESTVRRAHDFIEARLREWRREETKRREEMSQARSALAHARAMHDGKSTGCVEQEMDLRKAQERVRQAEEKIAACRRWQRDLPGHLKEYEGPARVLGGFIETDLRRAVALLDGKVAALNAYLAVAAPEEPS